MYDSLRKEWKVWYNLFGKVTGLGWNFEKNTVDASDEWWEKKELVCESQIFCLGYFYVYIYHSFIC